MSDRMRITGMNSGMDTESIVQQLVAAKQIKVENLKSDQKKLEWKQTAWQDLNSKIYNLYSNTLSKLRLTGAYKKKTTTSSDPSKATVTADGNAVDGIQELSIKELARASYLTGDKISKEAKSYKSTDALSAIDPSLKDVTIKLKDNATDLETVSFTVGEGEGKVNTISEFVKALRQDKYNVSINKNNGVINIGMPADSNLEITDAADGFVLKKLGIEKKDGESAWTVNPDTADGTKSYTPASLLVDIDKTLEGKTITLKDGDFEKTIKITKYMTLSQFADQLKASKYEASFDEQKQRFEIRDEKGSFTISDGSENGSFLSKLGIDVKDTDGYIAGSSINQPATTYAGASKLGEINPNVFKGTEVGVTAGAGDDTVKKQMKYPEFTVKVGEGSKQKETKIELKEDMTISELVTKLRDAGLNASFDDVNQRFFINAKDTGKDNNFFIEPVGISGSDALAALGITQKVIDDKFTGTDSKITLNGVEYTSTKNTFNINGLTINAMGKTDPGSTITITTSTDCKGAYDTIKEFLSEYNDLINEIDKLYNADSARKYKMLSSDQKEAMSDEEVEKWEGTIKGSLLRRDTQLRTIMDVLTRSMNDSLFINGKKLHLSDYGIKTLDYFKAKDNEHYAYHIDGDADDDKVSGAEEKLMKALAADPDTTIQFFADLSKNVYDKVGEIMNKTNEYSSIYKVYNDKQLKKDYDNYTKKIKDAEDKLSAYEDKWYDKFAAMEKALAKLQSNQSAVSSMFGK